MYATVKIHAEPTSPHAGSDDKTQDNVPSFHNATGAGTQRRKLVKKI